jgi:hypothetical protein
MNLMSAASLEAHAAAASALQQTHMATQHGQPHPFQMSGSDAIRYDITGPKQWHPPEPRPVTQLQRASRPRPVTQTQLGSNRTWFKVTGSDNRRSPKPHETSQAVNRRTPKRRKVKSPAHQHRIPTLAPRLTGQAGQTGTPSYISPYKVQSPPQAQSQPQSIPPAALTTVPRRPESSHAEPAQDLVSPSSSPLTPTSQLSLDIQQDVDVSEVSGSLEPLHEAVSAGTSGDTNLGRESSPPETSMVKNKGKARANSQGASACQDVVSTSTAEAFQNLAQSGSQYREGTREATEMVNRVRANLKVARTMQSKEKISPLTKQGSASNKNDPEGDESEDVSSQEVEVDTTNVLSEPENRGDLRDGHHPSEAAHPPPTLPATGAAPPSPRMSGTHRKARREQHEPAARQVEIDENYDDEPESTKANDVSKPWESSDPDAIELVMAIPSDSTGRSVSLTPLRDLPIPVWMELETHLGNVYRGEDREKRCAEFTAAKDRPLRVAEGVCMHSMVCNIEMGYTLSGGNVMQACDQCIHSGTPCARIIVQAPATSQSAVTFVLVVWPLPERVRQGAGWQQIEFWLCKSL